MLTAFYLDNGVEEVADAGRGDPECKLGQATAVLSLGLAPNRSLPPNCGRRPKPVAASLASGVS